jgi:hypothetical protein
MRLSEKGTSGIQHLVAVCRHIQYDKVSGKFYWRYPTVAPFGFYPILGFQELLVSELKELLPLAILAYRDFKEPSEILYINKRVLREMQVILENLRRAGFRR